MKKLLIAAIVIMAIETQSNAETCSVDELIDALIQVESSGRDTVVGDNGKAVGCLQIHKVVIDDVNRYWGTHYTLADRTDRGRSREICRKYLAMYANQRQLGRKVTNEDRARIWNGGPKGYAKTATEKYWEKVRRKLS